MEQVERRQLLYLLSSALAQEISGNVWGGGDGTKKLPSRVEAAQC